MILALKILTVICIFINDLKACPSDLANCKNGMIRFFLFGSLESDVYELRNEEQNIKAAPLARHEKIKILILNNLHDSDMDQILRKEYYLRQNVSVITVDFSALAAELRKRKIRLFSCLPFIARCTSLILRAFKLNRVDIQLSQFHIIAFGEAANIPGFMASQFKTANLGQLERITILEPVTYPDFSFVNQKTTTKSAKLVDVYHTNAGKLSAKSSSAHVEVFFNDGQDQPGCNGDDICSHKKVISYYAESINSDLGFFGSKCLHHFEKSCETVESPPLVKLVGEYTYAEDMCTAFVKQIFVVKTNEGEPHAQGPSSN